MAASNADGSYVHELRRADGSEPSVREKLEFILSLPANAILVGFFFKYERKPNYPGDALKDLG